MLSESLRFSRVVLIDDVAANLRLIESSLRACGLSQVKSFSSSAEGLQWLQENVWDLLLLDLDMPEPNGFAILEALKGRDRNCSPVIIVTALSDVQDRRRGLELGANDYLCKPLDLPELLLRVRNNLQLSLASRTLQEERNMLDARVRERTEQLHASYQAVIRSLARAAEYKDNETGNHILRIGESAALIAHAIGKERHWVELLRLAAPMHDVGKIGIPDQILGKPGRLTDEERELMNRHPLIGYQILHDQVSSSLTDLAAEVALNHHERWDGSGYPRGLRGEQIPLSARIVALCDVYDALRSPRPYKAAWSSERAQEHIREQAGQHFDPQLVEVMIGLFEQIETIRTEYLDGGDTPVSEVPA